ncbi:MAG: hypothetical protein M1812_004900 [Candelaria pacifica]|nr:MAG: hypothetical protein M1812_004900 [Candelaria pacifica]
MASKPPLHPPTTHLYNPSTAPLPKTLYELIMSATTALRPPFPPSTCQKYSGIFTSLSASQTTIGIYCGLVVLIPILSLSVPCLANTALKTRRQSLRKLWTRLILAFLLFTMSIILTVIQAYTIQIYYFCNETPVWGRYVTMWVLFALFSGGSVGCAGIGILNLALECWKLPPGCRRNWVRWWIFPIVVLGVALAPLVLMFCLWRYWCKGADEGDEVVVVNEDLEMAVDTRRGEVVGGSELSGKTMVGEEGASPGLGWVVGRRRSK